MSDVVAPDNANAGASAPAASAPSAPAPTPTPTADAAPTSGGVSDVAVAPEGPIPFDRHKSILENTRKEYEEKYGWLGDRTRDQIEQQERWYQWFDADPVAALQYFQARLSAMPEYAPRLQQGQPPQGQPPALQGLQPDGQMPDGTPVFTASNVERFVKQLLNQEIGPIKQSFTQQQIEQETAQAVNAELAEARANWLHFTELEPEIRKIYKADKRTTLYSAHQRALKAYMDKHDQGLRSSVVSELNKKASATTVSPSQAPALTPVDRSKLSWEDALKAREARR